MLMKRAILIFLLFICTLFTLTAQAAEIPPKPTGTGIFVQDYAHVISDTNKQKIISIGKELEQKTTAQVAVLTVLTLDKQPIEAYALDVLRAWGIGSRESNNGVLIIIATQDKQSRIEVGYGLEGVLPDGLTGRIQNQYMLPFFKAGDYSKGILQGYAATTAVIAKEANVELSGVKYNDPVQEAGQTFGATEKLLIGLGITALLLVDNFLLGGVLTQILLFLLLFGRGGRGGNDGFGGGSGGGGGSSRRW